MKNLKHNYFPETKYELMKLVVRLIEERGLNEPEWYRE